MQNAVVSIRKAYFSILILAVLLGWSAFQVKDLNFGYKLENFFTKTDPDFKTYQQYKERFGNENNFVMLAFASDSAIFNLPFIQKIDTISKALKLLPGIKTVYSPTLIKRPIKVPLIGVLRIPLIDQSSPEALQKSRKFIQESPQLYNRLIAANARSILVYLELNDSIIGEKSEAVLQKIKAVVGGLAMLNGKPIETHYAGQVNTRVYYKNKLYSEVVFFTAATLVLLIAFLYFTYQSFFVIGITIVVLTVSVFITLALISVFIGELDFLMTMLPTILYITGISTVVHLISTYKEGLEQQSKNNPSGYGGMRSAQKATFLSAITTAIGFFALYFLPSAPIQVFGIFTGLGILITWVTTVILFPALLAIAGKIRFKKIAQYGWENALEKKLNGILKYKRIYIFGMVAFTVLTGAGTVFIRQNAYFLDDLSEESGLYNDMAHFNANYGGIRPFEMSVTLKDSTQNMFSLPVLQELDTLANILEKEYGVAMLQSLPALIKETNVFLHSGNLAYYVVPKSQVEMDKIEELMRHAALKKQVAFLVDSTERFTRFTGKLPDLGLVEINKKNVALERTINSFQQVDCQLTGAAHLMDKTNQNVSYFLLTGLVFSFVLITIFMAIALKSVKLAFFALIPNLTPLVVVLGLMGWLGIDLKIGTALIFTVVFGIAVDDTIHFLIRYQDEYKKNAALALKETYRNSGKKLILTSIILSGGFLAFTFSEFNSTFYAGWLITGGLIVALLADLIQLPLIIRFLEKK